MFHLNQNWNCARSLQTFAIPGSLFLSILSGFLFNFPVALTLVCFCSALGATLCYMLSQLVGRRIVKHFFPKRANDWAAQVERHKDELLSYMLFLRMTPFLPNWFINLVAPVIGVPLFPFAVGTFFGMHFFCSFEMFCNFIFWRLCRCSAALIPGHSSWQNSKHDDQFDRCRILDINVVAVIVRMRHLSSCYI